MTEENGVFIETREYLRFCEFCDACLRDRYIGLCYGPPGVGKTLSARRYANWGKVEQYARKRPVSRVPLGDVLASRVALYTAGVVNTPKLVEADIRSWRDVLRSFLIDEVRRQKEDCLEAIRTEEKRGRDSLMASRDSAAWQFDELAERTCGAMKKVNGEFFQREQETEDPTRLLIVDEADRLKMDSLEQVRAVFDAGNIGVVLIGMPGIEKRLARYPQLYSRVGFVHEFRTLSDDDVRQLLTGGEVGSIVIPGTGKSDEESIAMIIRIAGGNFRLLLRLLKQIDRILEINQADVVTAEVVEVARENLVIGSAV